MSERWTASQYLDTDEWGVIDYENQIIVGIASKISKQTAERIAKVPEMEAKVAEQSAVINELVQQRKARQVEVEAKFAEQSAAIQNLTQDLHESRQLLINCGFYEGCRSCGHSPLSHGDECEGREANGSPCGCPEFKPNETQLQAELATARETVERLREALKDALEWMKRHDPYPPAGGVYYRCVAALTQPAATEEK